MNRLYAVEIDADADRGAGRSSAAAEAERRSNVAARAIAAGVGVPAGRAGLAGRHVAQAFGPATQKWIAAVAKDLQAHRGRSLVIAGDAQPPAVHALAHAMNQALGNVGKTVVYTQTGRSRAGRSARRRCAISSPT